MTDNTVVIVTINIEETTKPFFVKRSNKLILKGFEMTKKKVAVFGTGKIGSLIIHMLAHSDDYQITAVDRDQSSIESTLKSSIAENLIGKISIKTVDFSNKKDIEGALSGYDYVISAAPFQYNVGIAEVAKDLGVHYLDLTEDIKTTKRVRELAHDAQSAFIPQCGLAPGFITIAANHIIKQFDKVTDVKMRVGALPLYPHNRLKYNLTWSTEGLINEYCNPCEVIIDGELKLVPALEGHEYFSIDGLAYEAFYTSGGVGALAESLEGRVSNLDYKSIRYPGHKEILCTLLHDLKFSEDRETLKKVFERSLAHTSQDVVIIFVTVTGEKSGRFNQETYCKKIYHSHINDKHWGAIQISTAAGICTVLDLHATGELKKVGLINQEEICYDKFIQNRFGVYYNASI